MEGHLLPDVVGHVVQVDAVALRQDHLGQPRTVCGEDLLADTADWQDLALQGHLARHADHRSHRAIGQQADQRGGHRDAGGRSVLGHTTGGHVQVEPSTLEGGGVDAELLGVRAHVGERYLGGLLHDLAELPGQRQAFGAVHRGGLDEEHVATDAGDRQPGRHTRHARAVGGLEEEPRTAQPRDDIVGVDAHRCLGAARGDGRRDLAHDLAEGAFERAHARLTRVVRDDRAERLVGDLDLVGTQPRTLDLAAEQVVAGDGDLLVLHVAVEGDDLHAVEQRQRDRVEHVRSRQEHHVGQVEVDLEVVVLEGVVLRRVEHLEQRRGRVTPHVGAELVDLVEQDDGVHGAGLPQGTHQATRLGADVGATVAADLGLVAHATEGDADELPVERPGHRLAQRGLADTGRADEDQDRPGPTAVDRRQATLGAQLAHREVFEDALLHVHEPVVVLVEDVGRGGDVEGVLGADTPGQLEHGVEPGADPAALGALLVGALQLVELTFDRGAHVVGQRGRVDAGTQVVTAVCAVAQLAELLADRVHLATQQELTLGLLHALLDVGADALAQRQVAEGLPRPLQDDAETLLDVDRLEHPGLLLEVQVGRVARRVRERTRLGHVVEYPDQPGGAALGEDVLHHGAVLTSQLVDGTALCVLLDRLDAHPQRGARAGDAGADARTLHAAHHHAAHPVGQLAGVLDRRDRADTRVAALDAGHEQQVTVGRRRCVDRGASLVGLDRHGDHHPGQDHARGQRQQRQGVLEQPVGAVGGIATARRVGRAAAHGIGGNGAVGRRVGPIGFGHLHSSARAPDSIRGTSGEQHAQALKYSRWFSALSAARIPR